MACSQAIKYVCTLHICMYLHHVSCVKGKGTRTFLLMMLYVQWRHHCIWKWVWQTYYSPSLLATATGQIWDLSRYLYGGLPTPNQKILFSFSLFCLKLILRTPSGSNTYLLCTDCGVLWTGRVLCKGKSGCKHTWTLVLTSSLGGQ